MRRLAVAVPRPRRFAGLAVLLLGLLLSLQALAAPPKPLLWKVSDADNAVYLLGSFHMLRPGDYPVAREVQEALAGAGSVVFELSPDEANSPRLAATMVQAAQRKRPGTLEGDLGPRLSARLRAYADARGLPLERLSGFDPWFVGLTLSLLQLQQQGLDPALGLDRHLMDAAAAAGKPTAGLETGAAQIAALSGMPVDAQLQMLEQALDQAEAGPGSIESMHRAWRSGDGDALWRQMGADLEREHPALYRRINVDRNEAWLPQLEARLARPEGDTLVVVGALHLLGPDGLVERLRAKGYKVERVCRDCAR